MDLCLGIVLGCLGSLPRVVRVTAHTSYSQGERRRRIPEKLSVVHALSPHHLFVLSWSVRNDYVAEDIVGIIRIPGMKELCGGFGTLIRMVG